MDVFKATPYQIKDEENSSSNKSVFKATKYKTYDPDVVSDWQTTNTESWDTISNYYNKIKNSEYLSADDMTAYRTALDNYISSTNSLRGISKTFGSGYTDEEEKKWTDAVSNMNTDYDNINSFYSNFKNEDKYKEYLKNLPIQEAMKITDMSRGERELELVGQIRDAWNEWQEKLDKVSEYHIGSTPYNEHMEVATQARIACAELERQYESEFGVWYNGADISWDDIYKGKSTYYDIHKYSDPALADEEFENYAQLGAENNLLIREDDNIIPKFNYFQGDELKVYNYYLGKGDTESASKYLEAMSETLTARHGAAVADQWDDNIFEKYLFGFFAGMEQFATGIGNLFTDEDYYETSATQIASGIIREDLADDGFKIFGNSIGQIGYDAFNTTGNMLPSILVGMATGGVGGTLTLGASAAGNGYAEMINLGYNKGQAALYGVLVGASEGLLQYAIGGVTSLGGKASGGLTNFIANKVDNAFARVAIKIGGNMIAEGMEESIQTILEPWFKSIATGVDYDAPNIDEILYSGLLGALTAGVLETGGTIASDIKTTKVGKTIQKADAVSKLTDIGSTYSMDTVAYHLAHEVNKNENVGAYTIGRLFQEVNATMSEQNKADIIAGLEAKGIDSKTAKKLAEQYQSFLNGEMKLTDAQIEVLEKADPLSDVLRKNIIGRNTTVYQRTRAYSDLRDLANEVSGAKKSAQAQEASAKPTFLPLSNEEIARRMEEGLTKDGTTEIKTKKNEFAYSADGKTIYQGNDVSVKGIDSIKNGVVSVRLDNDEVVNAKDVSFSTKEEALMYEMVADLGVTPQTATAMMKIREKGNASAQSYRIDAPLAYQFGKIGYVKGLANLDLSTDQRTELFALGKADAEAEIKANAKSVKDKVESAKTAQSTEKESVGKNGKVHFDKVAPITLTKMQKKSIKALEVVAETLGVDIVLFESPVNEKGKRIGENGSYDPKTNTIRIDIFAGVKDIENNGKATMLFTAAHELTHFIREWSPAKFKVFADFLIDNYAKKGKSVEYYIQEQIRKGEQNNRWEGLSKDEIYDRAYEEFIADSCEAMLTDSNAIEKLALLKAKDKGLFNKIKSFIGKLVAKIKAFYATIAPNSDEGKMVREMVDVAEQLHALWTDALVDAGEAYSTIGDMVQVDAESDSVYPMFSERTWTESEYVQAREETAEKLAKALGVSKAKALAYIDDINSIAKMIADDRTRLDYNASPFGSAFVGNVEYGGSFDFTTLCKKRRIYTGTFSEIQRRLQDTALTPDDILKIRNMLIEKGIEATCGLCYVEGSRANMGKFAKEFIRLYKRDNPNAWIPNMADVNTPDGVESMKINHPEAYEQYEYFWNHYGKLKDSDPALFASQQKPKLYEARKEYKGEILKAFKNDSTVEKKNLNGGIRMQSFSDFEIVHMIDTMQIIMDMASVGLAGQAYTKVVEFAEAFGNTGLKINLSLIAKGVDKDGNLIFDDREGMAHSEAFRLRDKYSANVGTIIVTFTDAQLLAAMADPRIDYIIPFHRSQWKQDQYGAMGLPKGTKDYTFMQNEKLIKQTYHEYRGTMVKDKASNYMPNEYWDFSKSGKENAEAYLKMCAENNKRPKFYKLLDYDGKGTYSLKKDGSTDGYWKLLIDFKMYDNDGVGSPQLAVTPNFSMNEATHILDEYRGGHQSYPVANDVVDTFVKEYKSDTKFSDRDSKGKILSKEQQEFFKDSKVRDENGNLRVVYHSTDADFTVFDKAKIGSGNGGASFGKGFYFATYKDLAGDYGDNMGEYYLNIKNPFEYYTVDKESIIEMLEKSKHEYDKKFVESYDYDELWDADLIDDFLRKALINENPYAVFSEMVQNAGYDGIWAGSEIVAFTPEQIKLTTNKNPTSDPDIRYSLREVNPVEPTSDKWSRTLTTAEVKEKFPNLWDVSANESEVRNPTQISGTVKSYRKVYDFLKAEGFNGTILDASSGLGYGTRAGVEEYGFKVDDIEPYPDKSYKPKYTDYSKLNKKYDVIISNAVLNVIPQDQRDALVVKMGELLKDGGRMFINVRGDDVKNASSKVAINEDLMEYYISNTGSYQKGFNKSELVAYLQDALGEGFTVKPISWFGKTSAIVTKNDVKYSDRDLAPTFYSQMGKVVDGMKQDKFAANSVISMLRGRGVKAEEIRWSGIATWLEGKKSVTKQELLEFIRNSQLQIGEQMSDPVTQIDLREGNANDYYAYQLYDKEGNVLDTFIYDYAGELESEETGETYLDVETLKEELQKEYGNGNTRWYKYSLEGGTNYREIVFTMPNSTYSNSAMKGHWGQDAEGILVHARIQDFVVDGKKMLFIEELQSDWHNEGKKIGYNSDIDKSTILTIKDTKFVKEDDGWGALYHNNALIWNIDLDYGRNSELSDTELHQKALDAYNSDTVMGRLGNRELTPDAPFEDTYHEYVLKRLLRMAAEQGYDSIGWTIAEIQSKRWSYDYEKAYRIEYDQEMPKFMSKYGRQWGAKVEKSNAPNGEEIWSMDLTDSMKDSVLHEGQVLYSDRDFASQVDAVLSGADTNSSHLKVMDTPSLLQQAGLPNLPILMTAKHLKSITSTEGKGKVNYHGLDVEMVKKLPEYISDPVMIADSFTRSDSVVIITEVVDSDNRPVIAAIMLNGEGRLGKKHINANIMTSAYGRNNFQSFLNRIADENAVIYWNEKKSQDMSVSLGIQFPNAITSLNSNTIIRKAKAFVKEISKNSENSQKNSDRDPDSVSNRSLLANALESAAQNDIERNKLAQYKQKIDLINAEEARLHDINEQLKDLYFTKGKRDAEKIRSLKFEQKQAENRINTYDRQLLTLEASKPLKDVLEREKQLAYKKAEQRGKEALSAYREKTAKNTRELLTRWQESRHKAVESRHMTEYRHKIKDVVSQLNQLLLRPTKDKHIKEELKNAVAQALSVINMDTVGAEARIAKLNERIAKETDPDVIEELTKSRDRIELQGENLKDKLTALQSAYEKVKNSTDAELKNAYQETVMNAIKGVVDMVGNTSIRDMSLTQLEAVYEMYKMVLHTVRTANKAFKAKKGETITQMSEAVNDEIRKISKEKFVRNPFFAWLRKVGWTFLKPFTAFRTIGSDTFTDMFKELRNGEDIYYVDINEAKQFIQEQYKKHNFKDWDQKQTKSFKAKSGKEFTLTLEQMMSLYAYSRRHQAHDHIIEGGIVLEDSVIETKKFGLPFKYKVDTKTAFNISEETLQEICDSLTDEQRAYVDDMQAYLSDVMGAKGNEVSMELLGVKLFKEKFYFPLKSSQYYMGFKAEEAGEIKLKNPAFSKETVQHANNPVVLKGFTDVWATHVSDMSMYHAFVLPLEDFTRVYNYKTRTDANVETMSTEATIANAYGEGATQYIRNFLRSLNGGVRVESVGLTDKMTSLMKKGAVLGSASVAIQQPSAIMRAMALINPKHFVTSSLKSLNFVKHNKDWAELKQYAPIAGIKEMGRFDVGMGQSTVKWIKDQNSIRDKADEALSKAPALMDEITWVSIWNAVKNEVKSNNKDLEVGSEAYFKKCGERFTEVISLTQVYDSVFSRSDIMRNQSWIAKALTAFMAEPTTTLNMMVDAWVQGKRTGSMKGFVKITAGHTGAIVASIVLNSALKSIITAMRDDDEDESYAEKYLGAFVGNAKDNLNPLTYIPFVKDIVSIFDGYDVERMDMALFADLKQAIDAFDSDSKNDYEKWTGLTGAISAFFGIPYKNVERDIRGAYETIKSFIEGEETTKAGIWTSIREGWTGDEISNTQQLYEAYLKDDKEQIERVEGRFEDKSAIETALRKALRENDPRIREAAQAVIDGNHAERIRLTREIVAEGHFRQDIVVAAINAELDAIRRELKENK